MPFSFKPTQGTETQTPDPGQSPGMSGTSGPLSFGSRTGGTEGKSLLEVVLSGTFVLAIGITTGLFGYRYYLQSQVTEKKVMLDAFEKRLGVLPLDEMRKVSNRLKIISQLIKDHPSVNAAFRIIEESVENPVTYNRFELSYSDTMRAYQLQLGAVAPDYGAVIEQVDTLKRKPFTTYLSNLSVEGVRPNDKGQITFTLKMPIAIAGVVPEALMLGLPKDEVDAAAHGSANEDFFPAPIQATSSAIVSSSTVKVQSNSIPKKP